MKDDNKDKVDEAMEQVREHLKQFIGQSPSTEVLQKHVEQVVQRLYDATWTDRVREIFMASGMLSMGFGSAFDLEKLLKAATDLEIDWLWRQFGEALKLLKFEWCVRNDMLTSWRVVKEEGEEGNKTLDLEYVPKKPLNYIKIDLTLENKDDEDVPDPSASG